MRTVDELERVGYVERTPDPADDRAKLVRLTPRAEAVEPGELDRLETLLRRLRSVLWPDTT